MTPVNHSGRSRSASLFNITSSKVTISFISLSVMIAFSAPIHAGTTNQTVTFNSVGQSMWNPGDSIAFSNLNDPLFLGVEWDKSGDILNIGDATSGGNGVSVSGSTSGKVGLEMGWNVNSGTLNTSLPLTFALDTPDRNELNVGSTFSFGVSSAKLEAGAFMRSVSPTIQAYADLILEAQASITAMGCYNALFSQGCSDEKTLQLINIDNSSSAFGRELLSINIDPADRTAGVPDGEIRVLGGFEPLLAAGSSTAKLIAGSIEDEYEKKAKAGIDESGNPDDSPLEEKSEKVAVVPKPRLSVGLSELAQVEAKLPEIDALGKVYRDRNISNSGLNNAITTNSADEFLSVAFDVDTAGTLLGITPPLGAEASLDFGIGSVSASLDLLDLTLTPSLSLTQDLSLNIKDIGVSYAFSDGQATKHASSLTDKVDVMWSGKDLGITPTYTIAAEVTNKTGLAVDFAFDIDLLKGSIGAEVIGFDLGSESFGPLASIPVDLGGFAIPSIFDDTFDLGGFSTLKGQTVNIAISEAQFKSGSRDWDASSSWEGISGTPSSTTDVQIGLSGANGYDSRAKIDDCNFICNTDQQEVVGNVTIVSGSALDIGGKNGGAFNATNEDNIYNSLSIKGDTLNNDGAIFVYTNDSLRFSSTADTEISGTGFIRLQDGGRLRSDGNGVATVNISGQQITLHTNTNKSHRNMVTNLDLNMERGAKLLVDGSDRLTLINSIIQNTDQTYAFNGDVMLNNSLLTNIDNAGLLQINAIYQSSNNSAWSAGKDGLLLNTGTIKVEQNENRAGSSRLQLRSDKVIRGAEQLTLTNNGTIQVAGVKGIAVLEMQANITQLRGSGTITLSKAAFINASDSANQLINENGHSITGHGSINYFQNSEGGLINNGNIWADGDTLSLTSSSFVNNGLAGARSGALLKINATTMPNVSFASGGGLFDSWDRLTLTSGGTFRAENNGRIDFYTGSSSMERFVNHATIELLGSNANITLTHSSTTRNLDEISRVVNLGTMKLVNHEFAEDDFINFFDANEFLNYGNLYLSGSSRIKGVSNKIGGLIEGHGIVEGGGDLISGKLTNQGTIRATGEGKTLLLRMPSSLTTTWANDGRIEVMNGAELVFEQKGIESFFSSGDTFSGGGVWAAYAENLDTRILFDAGSAFGAGVKHLTDVEVILSGAKAGFFTRSGGQLQNLTTTLQTISADATLALENGQVFTTSNTVVNNGTLRLMDGQLAGATFTNNGLIHGYGTLEGNTLTNNALIRAEDGRLTISRTIVNTLGEIQVGSGKRTDSGTIGDELYLDSASINGGSIVVKENGLLQGSGSINSVLLANQGTITASNKNQSLNISVLTGSVNNGALNSEDGATLNLAGEALNNVSGTVKASNATVALQGITIIGGGVEVLGADAALRGYGSLENIEFLISEGTITADVNGQRLTLTPSATAQLLNATLQAENGGILLLAEGDFHGAGGTQIIAQNGSIVELKNVSISGAELSTTGTGKIVDVASSQLSNMHVSGNVEVASTGEFNLNGINRLTGSITVTAGGEIILHDSSLVGQVLESSINSTGDTIYTTKISPGNLRIEDGAVLSGAGNLLDINITNYGTIDANGAASLTIDDASDTFSNQGHLVASGVGGIDILDEKVINTNSVEVSTGSRLDFAQRYEQTSGSTLVNGEMRGGSLIISDSNLYGTGRLYADIHIAENASLYQRGITDYLTVEGDMDFDGTMYIDVFSDSHYDLLSINGDFTFSAFSRFSFNLGFDVFDGFSLDFLSATNFFDFNEFQLPNILFTGMNTNLYSQLRFNQDGSMLSLLFLSTPPSNKVSAPSMWLIILLVSGGVLWRRRHYKK